MKSVSIIGAGQLGSRHLQGLMKAQTELEVWVVDQSKESLKVAQGRCEEIQPDTAKVVHYSESIVDLPLNLDLVIVATGSKPRAAIVKSLLLHSTVSYLVLEKFLFTRLEEYDEIAKLLEEKNVKCWVNCPRRMWDAYTEIKALINPQEPVIMEYHGQDWGMCCNSVHYVDIWMFLAGNSPIAVDLSEVEPCVFDSKRSGYIELMGREKFITDDGDELVLGCYASYSGSTIVKITNDGNEIIVDGGKKEWSFNGIIHSYKQVFQSERTGILADELFENGNCRLVRYVESVAYHKAYLSAVIDFVNKVQGTNRDSCPIT